MSSHTETMVKEALERARRTETKVTKIANHLGIDSGAESAAWTQGRLDVPTRHASLQSCLEAVPRSWPEDKIVEVFCKDDFIMAFTTG